MTPDLPSSSEGPSLPPRHRPTLGNLAKDTTEMDLWAFEDDLDLLEGGEEPRPDEPAKRSSGDIPAPRESQTPKPRDAEDRGIGKTPVGGEDRIRMNINKPRLKNRPAGPVAGQSRPESDFDDLENWEDARQESPEFPELPIEAMPVSHVAEEIPLEIPEEAPVVEAPVAVAEADASQEDEFSPVFRENATPVSLRPHLGLSKVERIGLIVLAAILLLGGGVIFLVSLNGLPSEEEKAGERDFPIKGSHISIGSAISYWRAPITDGPEADTFRRDTQLLPVLEVAVEGGPGALRVLFRNEDHLVIGDAVTRTIRSGTTMKIPATAGFDDLGMHAAYRTGGSKPWTIEVYEAPSENTPGKEFKKLFEMNISAVRR